MEALQEKNHWEHARRIDAVAGIQVPPRFASFPGALSPRGRAAGCPPDPTEHRNRTDSALGPAAISIGSLRTAPDDTPHRARHSVSTPIESRLRLSGSGMVEHRPTSNHAHALRERQPLSQNSGKPHQAFNKTGHRPSVNACTGRNPTAISAPCDPGRARPIRTFRDFQENGSGWRLAWYRPGSLSSRA